MPIDDPLAIEHVTGKTPGTVIIHLTGPVTLRNLFDLLPLLRSGDLASLTILNLEAVPYMDSAGMGAIVNHYVHCQNRGARLIVSGVSSRVMELFRMTRVDRVIPLAASVEEAEAQL